MSTLFATLRQRPASRTSATAPRTRAKTLRRIIAPSILLLVILSLGIVTPRLAKAASYSCDETGLDAAIAAGGTPFFNCGTGGTITITGTKTITKDVSLDGASLLTIDGNGKTIFSIPTSVVLPVHFTVQDMTLQNGKATGAPNAQGGAMFISTLGIVNVINCVFQNNSAVGANGANGAAGLTGGAGGNAYGGAIYNGGVLMVDYSTFTTNTATGGSGGLGGPIAAVRGGAGGAGGSAYGGAIYTDLALGATTVNASIFNQNAVTGGAGGDAPSAGVGTNGGNGGNGGDASGGALATSISAQTIISSQFSQNTATGGAGGTSGQFAGGTNGGNGGTARGGAVYTVAGVTETSSLITNNATGGAGGNGTNGGQNGAGGNALGGALYVTAGTVGNDTFSNGTTTGGAGGTTALQGQGGNGTGGNVFVQLSGTLVTTDITFDSGTANAGKGGGNASTNGAGSGGNVGGGATLVGSIIANGTIGNYVGATLTAAPGNCSGVVTVGVTGNVQFPGNTCVGSTGDPQLNTLADNGGQKIGRTGYPPASFPPQPILTESLGAASAAIGANLAGCAVTLPVLSVDERYANRPALGCDSGAYEHDGTPPVVPTLIKNFSPNPIRPNGISTLTFTLSNPNSLPLSAVVFTDVLPAGVQIAATPNASFSCTSGALGLVIGLYTGTPSGPGLLDRITILDANLAANDSCVISVDVTAANIGSYTNNILAVSAAELGTGLLTGTGVTTPTDTLVVTLNPLADVALTMKVDVANPSVNTSITYTLTATNNGPDPATNVQVADALPSGLNYQTSNASQGSYNSGTGTWAVGNLGVNGSATLTITVTVTDPGPITNTGQATANETDPKPYNNFDEVTTNGPPLAARIGYVKSSAGNGDATIIWAAGYENSIIGYSIYTADGKTRLTAHIIPAHSSLGQSDGLYSATVKLAAGSSFLIADVGPSGREVRHGPYRLGSITGKTPTYSPSVSGQRVPDRAHPAGRVALTKTDAALSIAHDGIYHLTYEQLTAQGLDFANVKPALLALTSNSSTIPLYVQTANPAKFAAGDWIEFSAQTLDTFYSGTNVYVLTARPDGVPHHLAQPPSVTMQLPTGSPAAIRTTTTQPGRRYFWPDAPANGTLWTWALLENDIPALADQTVQLDLPRLYNAGSFADQTVTVTLDLRGWNGYFTGAPDHHAVADLAGAQADVLFAGNDTATLTLTLPASALAATGNNLRLRAPGDIGFQYDTMILERIRVTYPEATALPAPLAQVASVRAFTRAADLRTGITQQAGGTHVDDLVIAAPDFVAGVAPLAQLHRAEGLRVATVDVNAVYDSYSAGVVDPQAIKAFIRRMKAERGVQYVTLVGADSTDPRGYIAGDTPSYIPAFRQPDSYGTWAASDSAFADTTGDGLPDIALGRLPVQSAADLNALVAKLRTYSSAANGRRSTPNATFVSDPSDAAFAAMNSNDAAALGHAQTTQITWQLGDASSATQTLLSQWKRGQRLISYVGHSNADVWADDDVLDASILVQLGQSKPALLGVWGCWAATYDRAAGASLSEGLLNIPNGGAVGVVSATTEVAEMQYAPTALAFYQALGQGQRVGVALMQAKRQVLTAHPDWQDTAHGLTLLGDPAGHI